MDWASVGSKPIPIASPTGRTSIFWNLLAGARLIAAYEERKWPRRVPLLLYLMDQHGLTRADMAPILGSPSRLSEVLSGKKGLSTAMVRRLRARLHVPADLLMPEVEEAA